MLIVYVFVCQHSVETIVNEVDLSIYFAKDFFESHLFCFKLIVKKNQHIFVISYWKMNVKTNQFVIYVRNSVS